MTFRFLILPALLLSACATLTADREQTVRVVTTPEAGATCDITNGEQSWHIDSTPAEITVPRAYKKLTVVCNKDQVIRGKSTNQAETRGRAYGNILLLGVPAFVDAATGAGYTYPDTITVPLTPAQ